MNFYLHNEKHATRACVHVDGYNHTVTARVAHRVWRDLCGLTGCCNQLKCGSSESDVHSIGLCADGAYRLTRNVLTGDDYR